MAEWLGTDTTTVSKIGQFRSPYIACPFQPALLRISGLKSREIRDQYTIIEQIGEFPPSYTTVNRVP